MDRYNERYLVNRWQKGISRFRLVPTNADRDPFWACIESTPQKGGADGIGTAYRFFITQLALPGPDGNPLDLVRVERVIAERLAIVDITTGPTDNVHRIFESLNATGVDLTQADLLRNYLLMLLPTRQEEVYYALWQPLEDLIGPNNLEGLARVDLQRRGTETLISDVYRLHQERLAPIEQDEVAVVGAIRDLYRLAPYYKRLLDSSFEPDPVAASHLRFLEGWGAQSSHPVLMFTYDLLDRGLCSVTELRQVLSYVESFIVRRQLAGVPPNSLSRIFVQMINSLPAGPAVADAVRTELSRPRRYWPGDQQLKEAILSRPFYLNGRAPQRTLILKRFEESYAHPEQVDLDQAQLTVEHVLPQTISPEWRHYLSEGGDDPEEVHSQLVHTLGNLTLTAFNGTLSNRPFERKQQILSGSHLELNRALAEHDRWSKSAILDRAQQLAVIACRLWPGPIVGVAAEITGFDWSLVDAAVAAIPAGRWTTYGDLAALVGTAPVPVGVHLAGTAGPPNAYRVLGSNGKPSAEFRWLDPNDHRDVKNVLAAEGIVFGGDGAADPSLRLRTADLSALVVDPEPAP